MVRIAGLKRRIAAGVAVRAASGLLPREVLDRSLSRSRELMDRQAETWRKVVLPALVKEGIDILRWDELSTDERETMTRFFRDRVFPVLTPWPSTRRTRSRTSPACRSTWPWSSATPTPGASTSPG